MLVVIGHITICTISNNRAPVFIFSPVFQASVLRGLICAAIQGIKIWTPTTTSRLRSLLSAVVVVNLILPLLVTLALLVYAPIAINVSVPALIQNTSVLTATEPILESLAVGRLPHEPEVLQVPDVLLQALDSRHQVYLPGAVVCTLVPVGPISLKVKGTSLRAILPPFSIVIASNYRATSFKCIIPPLTDFTNTNL